MKVLLAPGQGELHVDSLSIHYEEQFKMRSMAESVLGVKVTPSNYFEHDVSSALIVANAIACFQRYCFMNGEVGMVAGYSVGQYAALSMAGVIEPEVAIKIVVERARIMGRHTLPNMRMMGVTGLSKEIINLLIAEVIDRKEFSDYRFVEISNCNNSMNFTVAGNLDLLELLIPKLHKAGAMRTQLLQTEGAWHTRMLKSALSEFTILLNSHRFSSPALPFADNVTGHIECDVEVIKNNLIHHMTSPVRWEESINCLISNGAKVFFECGAGQLLTKINFFIDRTKPCISMSSLAEIERCVALQA